MNNMILFFFFFNSILIFSSEGSGMRIIAFIYNNYAIQYNWYKCNVLANNSIVFENIGVR